MSKKYFVYGVPGVGKSTLSKKIAAEHGYLYLELDGIRPKAQKTTSRKNNPFIYEYSTEAWKKFGELNKENAIKGFLAVRNAFQKYIDKELGKHKSSYVAEAVYVDPNKVIKDKEANITLLITSEEKFHYSHFFLHRPHSQEEDSQFKAARYIQEYLIVEADKLGIKVRDNNSIDPLSK